MPGEEGTCLLRSSVEEQTQQEGKIEKSDENNPFWAGVVDGLQDVLVTCTI